MSENPGPTATILIASSVTESESGSDDRTSNLNLDDETETSSEDKITRQSLKNDPQYFKMLHVGVPLAAVKQKMMSEGVDPAILD